MDHTGLPLQTTPYLPLPCEHSPDGATWTADIWFSSLLIYRPRKDERLSWPSWLTYSGHDFSLQKTFYCLFIIKLCLTSVVSSRSWLRHASSVYLACFTWIFTFVWTLDIFLFYCKHVHLTCILINWWWWWWWWWSQSATRGHSWKLFPRHCRTTARKHFFLWACHSSMELS